MLKNRVIPTLLLSGERLVKTARFANPKYVGDPVNAIRIFNDKEVDELMLLDIDASKSGSEPNYALLERIAGECFMPLCYGGGISSLEQARRLFALGIEKVSLQTAVLRDVGLVSRIAAEYGSQSVAVAIDCKVDWWGRRKVYSSARRRYESISWQSLLAAVVQAGAGELVLTSVNREGTRSGLDIPWIQEASQLTNVPIVAVGGVGSLKHISDGVRAGASAVGAGTYFVFHGPHRAVLITYPKYGELEACLLDAGDRAI